MPPERKMPEQPSPNTLNLSRTSDRGARNMLTDRLLGMTVVMILTGGVAIAAAQDKAGGADDPSTDTCKDRSRRRGAWRRGAHRGDGHSGGGHGRRGSDGPRGDG
jgi:hypothetical protein